MIPVTQHELTEADIRAVDAVLRSPRVTQGPTVEHFEDALCEYTGARHAVACSSGTMALIMACVAAKVNHGELVALPSLTFVATAMAVRWVGGREYLVDIDQNRWCMDGQKMPDDMIAIVVDFAGLPAGDEQYRHSFRRPLIADAAHSLGGSHKGRRVGTLGDMTCLSFHPAKAITTGEGGAVLTGNEGCARTLRKIRDHGRNPDSGKTVIRGLNGRMNELSAALGVSQLQRLDRNISVRRDIAAQYRAAFEDLPGVQLQTDNAGHAYHLFVLRLKGHGRDEVRRQLADRGVATQVHYVPIHCQELFQEVGGRRGPRELPVADAIGRECISIPLYPAMAQGQVNRVVKAVKEVLA